MFVIAYALDQISSYVNLYPNIASATYVLKTGKRNSLLRVMMVASIVVYPRRFKCSADCRRWPKMDVAVVCFNLVLLVGMVTGRSQWFAGLLLSVLSAEGAFRAEQVGSQNLTAFRGRSSWGCCRSLHLRLRRARLCCVVQIMRGGVELLRARVRDSLEKRFHSWSFLNTKIWNTTDRS